MSKKKKRAEFVMKFLVVHFQSCHFNHSFSKDVKKLSKGKLYNYSNLLTRLSVCLFVFNLYFYRYKVFFYQKQMDLASPEQLVNTYYVVWPQEKETR